MTLRNQLQLRTLWLRDSIGLSFVNVSRFEMLCHRLTDLRLTHRRWFVLRQLRLFRLLYFRLSREWLTCLFRLYSKHVTSKHIMALWLFHCDRRRILLNGGIHRSGRVRLGLGNTGLNW